MTHFTCKAAKMFLLSAASALVLAGFASADETVIGAGVTTGSGLRLRSEPSPDAAVITKLNANTAVNVLDTSNEKWAKVSVNGQTGYVAAGYLQILETYDQQHVNDYAETTFPGAPLTGVSSVLYNAFGEPVPVQDAYTGEIVHANTGAVNAFGEPVPMEDAFTGEIAAYTPAAEVNAFGEPVPAEDIFDLPEDENDFDLPLPDDAFLEEDFLNANTQNLAIGVGVITGGQLSLRTDPWSDADVIATLAPNSTVALLDDSSEGWCRISCGGYAGYIPAEFYQALDNASIETYAKVNLDGVTIHDAAFGESAVLQTLSKNDTVGVVSLEDGWYFAVSSGGTAAGYIRSDLLNLGSSVSSQGSAIIETAKKYLGVRYVYGGSTPRGFDCSGFTQYVFRQCGISIPRTASTQWNSGLGNRFTNRNNLQPGDLVFFNDPRRNLGRACSHCGIYIGDGKFIHASSSSGVKISSLSESYYNRYFKGGLHINY